MLALALAGCLPLGERPAGRQLVKERGLSGVFLSPAEREGVPSHILVTGPVTVPDLPAAYHAPGLADVFLITEQAAPMEGLGAVTPVIQGAAIPEAAPTRFTFATDAWGRVLVERASPTTDLPSEDPFELWRHDLATGAGERLAPVNLTQRTLESSDPRLGWRSFLVSPGRTQVFVADSGSGWLFGPTTARHFWLANDATFLGEDFYCAGLPGLADESEWTKTVVFRVRPDADPEVLLDSTGQLGIRPVVVEGFAPRLVVMLYTEEGSAPFALLDTDTREPAGLPAAKGPGIFVSASPDGHFLLFRNVVSGRLFLYDWTQDGYVILDELAGGKAPRAVTEWRPGTTELWFRTTPDGFGTWRPDRGLVPTFAIEPAALLVAPGRSSWFTPDGRGWFARQPSAAGERAAIDLGVADVPAAPGPRLNPEGTEIGRVFGTHDGKLLVETWARHALRNDIHLVDPATGTTRTLASAGHLVAVGHDRVLALVSWQVAHASGELVLVELGSGARTVLGRDVYAVDVDRGRSAQVVAGADPLAPGTRIAFLSRHRLESRDDGLWLAELP